MRDYAELHRLSYFLVRMPWLSNITWKMMGGSRWAVRYTLKSILNNPQSRTEAILDEVMYAIENTDSQQAFGEWQLDEMLWDGLRTNYTDKLHEITVPVLLVHGTQDAGVPLRYAERAATKFPNVRFEIINNAGHWTHRDYPDQFNALLLEHLQAAVT
ncbi:MAG: alpha/beta hydrolase [Chloroflexota bacterium]